jgi:hypothetical protein
MLSNPLSVKAYTHREFKFENKNALMASKKFIYCIIYEGEENKIGKILVKSSAIYLTARMGEEEGARKIQLLPLSDNMNQGQLNLVQRMYWMNLLKDSGKVTCSHFTCARALLFLIRLFCSFFVRKSTDDEFQENLLFCKFNEAQSTGEDIFQNSDLSL